MKAGRELDALVAEKVMGMGKPPYGDASNCPTCGYDGLWSEEIQPYSTDIAAAWMVVEHLKNTLNGKEWTGEFNLFFNGEKYECWWSFSRRTNEGLYETSKDESIAETAPLAICLAALKTIGVAK